jgi:LCP family protein required for cell wall assembly
VHHNTATSHEADNLALRRAFAIPDSDFGPVLRGGGSTRTGSRPPSGHARRPTPGRPAGDRQAQPGRPSRRRRRNPFATIALYALIALLVVLLYGLGALLYASSRITRTPVDGLRHGDVYHVLVTGSDSRADLTRSEQRQLSVGGDVGGVRTDTIFVLSISGSRAAMLAFPRDLFVTRCDGTSGRINAATGIDGQGCLVETVSQLSGLPIRHTIEIDFRGFRDMVDAVGGVEVCLDRPIRDRDAGIDLPDGCQVLQGSDALGYVRVRKIDDDLQRIKRQQQFLRALAGEVAQPSTVLNPLRLYRTAGAAGGALRADEALSSVDLLRMAVGGRGVANGRIVAETVPASLAFIDGASVLQVDQAAADDLFERFRSGAIFDEVPSSDRTVAPEDVEVRVLNGSGVEGLAARTSETLEAAGFVVVDVGNANATTTTVVRYPGDLEAEARTLADAAPGDVDLEVDDGVDVVTLVLGSSG